MSIFKSLFILSSTAFRDVGEGRGKGLMSARGHHLSRETKLMNIVQRCGEFHGCHRAVCHRLDRQRRSRHECYPADCLRMYWSLSLAGRGEYALTKSKDMPCRGHLDPRSWNHHDSYCALRDRHCPGHHDVSAGYLHRPSRHD